MKLRQSAAGVAAALILCVPWQALPAQQVWRCESSDGSITFSDLPCRSDIGQQNQVDATPHQGHRASPGRPAWTAKKGAAGARPASGAGRMAAEAPLSRRQRLALEHERAQLLSGLKRRYVKGPDRRRMIRDLKRIDRRLGIEPADVADMPFHNREVYEEHRIHPGLTRGSG
ncbi:MAG TPA: hypothetical protein VK972_09190 [Wenzhouxiangella sp.]|nr:hypothetical protein [Wenzhouxiangella sp.]